MSHCDHRNAVSRPRAQTAPIITRGFYRYGATIAGLVVFFGLSLVYACGDPDLYKQILIWYGIRPFASPFLDISAWLAVWDCARQGIDVISANPCDILQRSYSCSPLWIAASVIPLGVRDTAVVGCILDILFLLSLSLLPSPRHFPELLLVLLATLSTMVVFALERANPDILMFLMALAAGVLAEYRLLSRILGYSVASTAALLKYYPIMALVVVFREPRSILLTVSALILGCLVLFWGEYHDEITRGLPTIARGPYNTDMFAAQNLPFLFGEAAGDAARPSALAPVMRGIVTTGLYVMLLSSSLAVCSRLLRCHELRDALASLATRERLLLVVGSAVITGCFFAGQSTGYRGIFFLLMIPGLLAISRTFSRPVRRLSLGTAVVIVVLMWGECARVALYRALEHPGIPGMLADNAKILFWLFRELGWWWTISVTLTVFVDFLRTSPLMSPLSLPLRAAS